MHSKSLLSDMHARLVVVVALVMLALGVMLPAVLATTGCSHAGQIATAVIDCTAADNAAQIATVEAELQKLTGWSERYARATAAGVVIGGCALLHIVSMSPAPVAAASVLPEPNEGRATFERFRSEQAGGARFKTAVGLQ